MLNPSVFKVLTLKNRNFPDRSWNDGKRLSAGRFEISCDSLSQGRGFGGGKGARSSSVAGSKRSADSYPYFLQSFLPVCQKIADFKGQNLKNTRV